MVEGSRLPGQSCRCVWMRAGWDASQGDRSTAAEGREAFWSFLTEVPFRAGVLTTAVVAAGRKAGTKPWPVLVCPSRSTLGISLFSLHGSRLRRVYSPAPSLRG